MNIVRLDENFIPSDTESAVCIGKLDGVHIGHRKLLSKLRGYLKKGYHPTVLGFEMSPADFFTGSTTGSLTTEDEKAAILEAEGVETYGVYPVNEKTMGLPPDDFVREVLVRRLHAKAVVAGEDCSYGRGGSGNIMMLERAGELYGFETVCVVKERDARGEVVSSTRIRELVAAGAMERAAGMLGRPYSFCGTVVRGRGIGHDIGFATANLLPDEKKFLPPRGVYVSRVRFDDLVFPAVTNVGMNPTVGGERISIESHLLEDDEDMYGRFVTVELLSFVRPEKRFDSVNELSAQIGRDIDTARDFFELSCKNC